MGFVDDQLIHGRGYEILIGPASEGGIVVGRPDNDAVTVGMEVSVGIGVADDE